MDTTTNRRVFLATAAAPILGANDQPAFAIIGTGSRGRWLHGAFQNLDARCVAVCDVYEPNLELARKASPASARAYTDFRQMLEQQGIDFVVIATPDHQHCPNLVAALEAGRDVYIEKPLSMNLEESGRMVAAVRTGKQIVQVGMQRRSMEFIRQAKKFIDDDGLGKISMVKAMWNWHFTLPLDNSPLEGKIDWEGFLGPAPRRPLEPMRFRWWRGFWDYSGGNMTDQGTHLMDVVQWMTNSGPPRSAICNGKVTLAPGAEVPNVFTAVFDYPEFVATWTLNYRSSQDWDWSITFQGEKAAMVLDRKGMRVYKDFGASGQPWTLKQMPELTLERPDTDKPEAHPKNFLECIRTRREPNCTVEIAAAAVAGPHMANVAYRRGAV